MAIEPFLRSWVKRPVLRMEHVLIRLHVEEKVIVHPSEMLSALTCVAFGV